MTKRRGGGHRPAVAIGTADPDDVLNRTARALGGDVTGLRELKGGRSSLTYSAAWGGKTVVVKVAPGGLAPVRNRDVLRQARLLSALGPVEGVAVPEVYGQDAGDPPNVPPLFVMEFVPGESYEPRHVDIPDTDRPAAEIVRARAAAAAEMLACLHAADPQSLGLGDAPGTLAGELGRWRAAFESCTLEEKAARLEAECFRLLSATIPDAARPSVLHGDWRLGNMQCVGAEIRAVIDWEIWSVGDPRLDLAWMRLMSDPGHPTILAPQAPSLDPDELQAVYEKASGAAVPDLPWFDALARYKQASASALLVKNAQKRGDDGPAIDKSRRGVPSLLAVAHAQLTAGR
ncbi:phosphotransferase family protein [Amycolatopsis thermophila]|uniref:Aminoglycoside phosphotransferase (APT) family kinase protein n=1 Tax=Amycolatopsis thermophila TaxID=206084 RepID=A0ABU0F563_9PSEU|nr:phosphotransferase family protein [Amycolatopsis thermophila]MDQ0382677.1 aminoglycoside phosphotransferase (APT) family kinase protein [Amycolatopsis thermophila]